MMCSTGRSTSILAVVLILTLVISPDGVIAQSGCPAALSALQLNSVQSLQTLIRSEVEAEFARRLPAAVEAQVQVRLASTPGTKLYTRSIIVLQIIVHRDRKNYG